MSKNTNFKFNIDKKDQQITFTINTKIYPLTVVYQTAYLFLDQVYVFLNGDPKKELEVNFKLKPDKKNKLDELAGEFHNELLNQLLRHNVSKTNAKIREYIVSQALYNAVPNEVDELLKEVEEEDWQEDPLGIAKTWEEQQAEEEKPKENVKKSKKKK
ncbi:His-Xaa-Ser system protein HxsD [Patescibacteria group bacterium]